MATNPRDLLIRPVITEKTSVMMQDNKYTFKVPLTANKTEIRQAAVSYTHLTLPTNSRV